MTQNRNKLIDLFVGNMSNVVVHSVLEKAIDEENIRNHYNKEFSVSFEIAKRYREKLNPANDILPEGEQEDIKKKVMKKATAELKMRILKGYKNIDLDLVESVVEKLLKETKVS